VVVDGGEVTAARPGKAIRSGATAKAAATSQGR
jgi:hypothetical protein